MMQSLTTLIQQQAQNDRVEVDANAAGRINEGEIARIRQLTELEAARRDRAREEREKAQAEAAKGPPEDIAARRLALDEREMAMREEQQKAMLEQQRFMMEMMRDSVNKRPRNDEEAA